MVNDKLNQMHKILQMMEPVTITSEMVRELREQTGYGLLECKRVLTECRGDKILKWVNKK